MRPTSIITFALCVCAAACSRTTDTNGTSSTTSANTTTASPGSNALNNNPSGATPMNTDPSGVAPLQPSSADGVDFAAGRSDSGVAVGGGPAGAHAAADKNAADNTGAKAKAAAGDTKGSTGDDTCPGATDVRVVGNPGFCARACRSDIDCAPNGKCDGTGRTSAKGYSQPNGKYCTGMK